MVGYPTVMPGFPLLRFLFLAVLLLSLRAEAASTSLAGEEQLRPYLAQYCYQCHGIEDEAGDLNLQTFGETPGSWIRHQQVLADVLWVIEEGEMPPAKHPAQPSDEQEAAAIEHLSRMVDQIATSRRDDPGHVVMPRLTKAEYNRVIRDLTGHDLQPARFLPNDSLAGEGFANVGEAQGTTMGEIERFLGAADLVMQHLFASPVTGLNWFDAPLDSASTRAEYRQRIIRQIGEWYSHEVNRYITRHVEALKEEFEYPHIPYLQAAWEYKHRTALGRPEETFRQVALRWQPKLRPEILQKWWDLLHADDASVQLRSVFSQWHALPGPGELELEQVEPAVRELMSQWEHIHRYYSLSHRPGEKSKVPDLNDHLREGRHPFYLDLKSEKDEPRPEALYLLATDALATDPADFILWQKGRFHLEDGTEIPIAEVTRVEPDGKTVPFASGVHPEGLEVAAEVLAVRAPALLQVPVPRDAVVFEIVAGVDPRIEGEQSVQTVVLKEPLERADQLRWYPGTRPWAKDDNPSLSRVYSEYYKARNALIARGPKIEAGKSLERSLIAPKLKIDPRYLGGPWDKQSLLEEESSKPYTLDLFYLEWLAAPERKAILSNLLEDLQVIADPSGQDLEKLMQAQKETPREVWPEDKRKVYGALAKQQAARVAAERESAARLLQDWARRAWRRAVTDEALNQLLALYDEERERGVLFDGAVKIPLMTTLVSPHFLYRYQMARGSAEAYPLTDAELANRLSFFLWGSAPDAELLTLAEAGSLSDPEVLAAQTQRMLQDPRIDYLAVEFAGRWLQFAGFETFDGPDTDRFSAFTPELREAMFEEPRHFFLHLFQQDRPVTEILAADYTFANEVLAAHYGLAPIEGTALRKVSTAGTVRGGVLGMGAVLTRYSEPLRTSPVRRGHWIYENLMGYPMPEPPPNVPMIAQDDVGESGLSVREELLKHREDPGCASCHDKIDPLGIALENFDPIGGWRTVDSAEQPVDALDTTHDGVELGGVKALRDYLRESEEDFIRNFCEKLLGFALGRAVVLSDLPLIERMEVSLAEHDFRFSAALQPVLTSPQFLKRRDEQVVDAPLANHQP